MGTTGFQGANPERLDDLAGAFRRADQITAQALHRIDSIARSEQGVRGPVGDDFRRSLAIISQRFTACADRLAPMAAELHQHAEEQRKASGASGRPASPPLPDEPAGKDPLLVLTQAPEGPVGGTPVGRAKSIVCRNGECAPRTSWYLTDQQFETFIRRPEVRAFEERVIRRLYGDSTNLATLQASPYYHAYLNVSDLGRDDNVDLDRLWREYQRAPAPSVFGPHNNPVRTGDETWIVSGIERPLPGNASPFPIPLLGGRVTHMVDETNRLVANLTQIPHALHPGYIIRWIETVELPGGGRAYYSFTLGRGIGYFGEANQFVGSRLFYEHDQRILGRARR